MSTSPDALDTQQRIAQLEQRDERLTQLVDLLAQRAAAPAKSGRDWDAYAAVIASFIGLLALSVSGYTAYVQRQQLRAEVWPHLRLKSSDVDLSYYVSNEGTGPARVTAMRVTVDRAPVKTWQDVKKAAGFTGDKKLISSWISQGVLPAGRDFFIIRPGDNDESKAKFRELLPDQKHALSIIVCYCSVLDDCWVSATGSFDNPLYLVWGGCPIPDAERFEN